MEDLKNVVEEHPSIINQISSEIENKEVDKQSNYKISLVHSLRNDSQHLGSQMNQEGLSSPKYGRSKGKRGRKSLKELREAIGHCKDQQKIDELLNIGKGKCLPRAS